MTVLLSTAWFDLSSEFKEHIYHRNFKFLLIWKMYNNYVIWWFRSNEKKFLDNAGWLYTDAADKLYMVSVERCLQLFYKLWFSPPRYTYIKNKALSFLHEWLIWKCATHGFFYYVMTASMHFTIYIIILTSNISNFVVC